MTIAKVFPVVLGGHAAVVVAFHVFPIIIVERNGSTIAHVLWRVAFLRHRSRISWRCGSSVVFRMLIFWL